MTNYDYIIVGAGSAGCVLANRLSEDKDVRVLLLEAGPEDKKIWFRIPAGFSRVFQPSEVNWGYFTEPEPHLNNRKVYWPRGRVLGGTSSINGMVYTRGHRQDYDDWAAAGNSGWDWDSVLPYFKKSEANARLCDPIHGVDGPMSVQDCAVDDPGGRLLLQAAAKCGTPLVEDLNDGNQHGVARPQLTTRGRVRASSATEFLRPAMSRKNLDVRCNAMVHEVTLGGTRATGVRVMLDGNETSFTARREVILSGGVINSPQLLMLSGIGPGAHLNAFGIPVRHALAGVGQNLQDHAYCYYNIRTKPEVSWNHRIRQPRAAFELLNYLITGRGVMNMAAVTVSAYPKCRPEATRPDIQVSYRPFSLIVTKSGKIKPHDFPAVNASASLLRPKARGRIELASPAPDKAPRIFANYFDNDHDVMTMTAGLRWIRRVFEQAPLATAMEAEMEPGPNVQSDAEFETYIRQNSQSVYHPTSSCAMGVNGQAVVDPQLRVHGVQGLRVIDASVMPNMISSNTHAATVMIAEKGADMIKESWRR